MMLPLPPIALISSSVAAMAAALTSVATAKEAVVGWAVEVPKLTMWMPRWRQLFIEAVGAAGIGRVDAEGVEALGGQRFHALILAVLIPVGADLLLDRDAGVLLKGLDALACTSSK